jgi:hypothetical protein
MGYAETYRRSLEKPDEFWAEAAEAIEWERRWDRVLDDTRPPFYRWLAEALLTLMMPSARKSPRREYNRFISLSENYPPYGRNGTTMIHRSTATKKVIPSITSTIATAFRHKSANRLIVTLVA